MDQEKKKSIFQQIAVCTLIGIIILLVLEAAAAFVMLKIAKFELYFSVVNWVVVVLLGLSIAFISLQFSAPPEVLALSTSAIIAFLSFAVGLGISRKTSGLLLSLLQSAVLIASSGFFSFVFFARFKTKKKSKSKFKFKAK